MKIQSIRYPTHDLKSRSHLQSSQQFSKPNHNTHTAPAQQQYPASSPHTYTLPLSFLTESPQRPKRKLPHHRAQQTSLSKPHCRNARIIHTHTQCPFPIIPHSRIYAYISHLWEPLRQTDPLLSSSLSHLFHKASPPAVGTRRAGRASPGGHAQQRRRPRGASA